MNDEEKQGKFGDFRVLGTYSEQLIWFDRGACRN
jgi:hypothetical protein